jgi:hypothetical protein
MNRILLSTIATIAVVASTSTFTTPASATFTVCPQNAACSQTPDTPPAPPSVQYQPAPAPQYQPPQYQPVPQQYQPAPQYQPVPQYQPPPPVSPYVPRTANSCYVLVPYTARSYAGTTLNVRDMPRHDGIVGTILGELPNYAAVITIPTTTSTDDRGFDWVLVRDGVNNRVLGWVFRNYLVCDRL